MEFDKVVETEYGKFYTVNGETYGVTSRESFKNFTLAIAKGKKRSELGVPENVKTWFSSEGQLIKHLTAEE